MLLQLAGGAARGDVSDLPRQRGAAEWQVARPHRRRDVERRRAHHRRRPRVLQALQQRVAMWGQVSRSPPSAC